MKKIILKIVLLFLIIFLLDRIAGFGFSYLFLSEKQGDSFITTYCLSKAKEDIIIMGSSRASYHYDIDLMEETLQLSCLNAGRIGMEIIYETILLKNILIRHHPKCVVLDVNPWELLQTDKDRKIPSTVAVFMPYNHDYPIIRKELKKLSHFGVLKSDISRLYEYNSMILPLLSHQFKIGAPNPKGFKPLIGEMKKIESISVNHQSCTIDTMKVRYFKEFVQSCKQHQIPLIVVISPIMLNYPVSSDSLVKSICQKERISFIDMSKDQRFRKREFFYNEKHLNQKGASYFTVTFLKALKGLIPMGLKN